MLKILLADDERNIRECVASELRKDGFLVTTAKNGAEAIDKYTKSASDIVILDVMMPIMDGFDSCAEIRKINPNVPILMFSAFGEFENRVKGLKLGADDFIKKESSIEELRLKITAVLRRIGRTAPAKPFRFGSAYIDPERFCLTRDGQPDVALTLRETEILRFLVANAGIPISWDALQSRFWGADNDGGDAMLKQAIYRIRTKLAENGKLMKTIRGIGVAYVEEN